MSRIFGKESFRDVVFQVAVILLIFSLIRYPSESVSAAKNGVDLCVNVILPSLFPFFVLSTLCVDLGILAGVGKILERIMTPVFRVGGVCAGAFLLGIIGGYPVGARTAIELYKNKQCSKAEAERLLAFCNNSGPAFILGVVGAGIFGSGTAGLWLYGAHVAASIIVGIIFRFYGSNTVSKGHFRPKDHEKDFASAFTGAIKQAFNGTLNICGFVIFFTVLIRLLYLTGIITVISCGISDTLRFVNKESVETIISGLIEMTSGVWSIRDTAASIGEKLCMAAFILGWAGLSVHCQVLSFIGSGELSVKPYFLGKMLHGMISAILISILSGLLNWNQPVSKFLATQVTTIARLEFLSAFMVSLVTSLVLWCIISVTFLYLIHKRYGNCRNNDV